MEISSLQHGDKYHKVHDFPLRKKISSQVRPAYEPASSRPASDTSITTKIFCCVSMLRSSSGYGSDSVILSLFLFFPVSPTYVRISFLSFFAI